MGNQNERVTQPCACLVVPSDVAEADAGDLVAGCPFADDLPVMVWMADARGDQVWSNSEWAEFVGRSKEQEVGAGWRQAVHPDDLEALTHARLAAIRSQVRSKLEYRVRRHDGQYRWILDTMAPRHDRQGRLEGFLTTAVDITEYKQTRDQLALERGFSQTLLEHLPGLCFVLDPIGRLLLWNRQAEEVTGYSREELLHRHASEMIRPEHRALALARIAKAMIFGTGHAEVDVLTKTGACVPYYFNSRRIELDGHPCLLGIGTDLTARREAERRLNLNHAALMAAANAVVITDGHGVIQWVNPAFTRLTGYAAEEVIGGKPSFLKSGQHPPEFYQRLWETITHGQVWRGQITNRRKDGSRYVEEMTITPVADEQQRIVAFIAIKQDVTERNAVQTRLREQAALLDQAGDAIMVWDLNDTVRYWNRGAETLFGWTAGQAVGNNAADLLSPPHAALVAARSAVLRAGKWSGEMQHQSRDGRSLLCQTRFTLVRNEAGEPQSILVINTDISEKKRLEAQFLRAQRLESIGQLAGGIAHDLNNILMPILVATPMLREAITDMESVSLLDTVEASAVRGAAIVKQVLTFSRGLEGDKTPVQLRQVVKEFARIVRETFPRSITLKVEEQRDLWLVQGDATQLHQVLMNLGVNARDAMPKGGILTIGLENVVLDAPAASAISGAKPGPQVLLRVTDTGTGISPEHIERIFDPFYTTKETGQGTGLGLSTVLGIVQSHGGAIQVNSRLREGADFLIYLPALDPAVSAPAPRSQSSHPKGNGELVLLVDDESKIRRVCQRMLESHGYRVLVAHDGLEAIELFQQHKHEVKVVITDLAMPRMDGLTLVHALRSEPPFPRIIAASGLVSGRDAEALEKLDLDAVLIKPLTASTLLTALRTSLDGQPPCREEVLPSSGLVAP